MLRFANNPSIALSDRISLVRLIHEVLGNQLGKAD